MAITVVFDPPTINDTPQEFETKAFDTIDKLNDWSTQANALASTANASVATSAASAATATTKATEAQTSATNAATSFTNFDNRYLGSKSVEPTTNNTGGALINGAIYWNSNTNLMRVWAGTGWMTPTNVSNPMTTDGTNVSLNGNFTVNGNTTLGDSSSDTVVVNGNIGIGGTPTTKLEVFGSVGNVQVASTGNRISYTHNGTNYLTASGASAALAYECNQHIFYNGDSTLERLRIDSAGNLGLGVVPSAWRSVRRAIDLDSSGSVWTGVGSASQINIGANAYEDSAGTLRYKNTGFASYFQQINGVYNWHTAPSGTAGNAITWTNVMSLEPNTFSVNPPSSFFGSTTRVSDVSLTLDSNNFYNNLIFRRGGTEYFRILGYFSNGIYSQVSAGYSYYWQIDGVERMRLDAVGNLTVSPNSSGSQNEVVVVGPTDDNWGGSIRFRSRDSTTVNHRIINSSTGMLFELGGVERARITQDGNLLCSTGSARPSITTPAISTTSTFTYNPSTHGQVVFITLTNAITVTFAAPTNIVQGAMYKFVLSAGDTASRTFAWNTAYRFPSASPVLTTSARATGAVDIITFIGGSSNTLIYDGHITDVR